MQKLLIIDDEIGPRESLRILLKHDYEIWLSDNVDEGMRLLKEHEPDVVIMDIRMPGKTGIEGLKELRQIDPFVSVIMLTGFGALETAQEAIRLGANDYLKKPFDIIEIQETIRKNANRSELEKRKRIALSELQNLNHQLAEDMASKEHLASIGQASAEFAHDLRNPLTIVMGYCELLNDQISHFQQNMGSEYQETVESLTMIEQNVQRCYELAEAWQKMGKSGPNSRVAVDLSSLLSEVVKSIKPLMLVGPNDVRYELDLEPVKVSADRSQLLRALYNVTINALHALPEQRGLIKISCASEEGLAVIRFTDNGHGISAENIQRIFEPYYTTKPEGKGTGLGLPITKKIVEEHGGMMSLTSQKDIGTEVTIRLPLLA